MDFLFKIASNSKMISTGKNTYGNLLSKSNTETNDDNYLIDPPKICNLDYNNLIDFSIGDRHSVYITKDGKAFSIGDDRTFFIGTSKRQIYKDPVEVSFPNISDPFISAKCGQIYTVYLTQKGIIVICSQKCKHFTPSIHTFESPIIYISAGYLTPVAIDARGDFYIFSNNPSSAPQYFHLNEPVYDICRCVVYVPDEGQKTAMNKSSLPPIKQSNIEKKIHYKAKMSFTAVVTVNGKVFANGDINNGSEDFSEVYSLCNVHIKHLYGYSGHCIAVSDDGRAFSIGDNQYGQLGIGTTEDSYIFQSINSFSNEFIVGASTGGAHSFLITKTGHIYGFGANQRNQLFNGSSNVNVMSPTLIQLNQYISELPRINCDHLGIPIHQNKYENKVTHVWCGNCSSIALYGKKTPIHLGFAHFFKGHETLSHQLRRISTQNVENLELQIKQLQQDLEKERSRNMELSQSNKNKDLNVIHDDHHKIKRRMEMRLADIFDENDRLAEENDKKQSEIEELRNENKKLKNENQRLKFGFDDKSFSYEEYQKEIDDKNKEISMLKKEIEEKDSKMSNLINLIQKPKIKTVNNVHDVVPPSIPFTSSIPVRHKTATGIKHAPIISKPNINRK